jgi:gamma-glutamylcyclotransferase (GGCT)/AIG2-like uncharacterized protein YtfP
MRVFSYGSNTNRAHREEYTLDRSGTPGDFLASTHLRAFLPDHRLTFNRHSSRWAGGVLSVVPELGCVVDGLLSDATNPRLLATKEGTGVAYHKEPVTLLVNAQEEQAETYIAIPQSDFCPPGNDYLRICFAGRRESGLFLRQLGAASKNSIEEQRVSHLFVYGTLMRGECRHNQLAEFLREPIVSPAFVNGRLYDCGHFPALELSGQPTAAEPGTNTAPRVSGELVAVSRIATVLEGLDAIEGFDGFGSGTSLYRRVLCRCRTAVGRPVLAWTYVAANPLPESRRIPSGCWRTHKRRT